MDTASYKEGSTVGTDMIFEADALREAALMTKYEDKSIKYMGSELPWERDPTHCRATLKSTKITFLDAVAEAVVEQFHIRTDAEDAGAMLIAKFAMGLHWEVAVEARRRQRDTNHVASHLKTRIKRVIESIALERAKDEVTSTRAAKEIRDNLAKSYEIEGHEVAMDQLFEVWPKHVGETTVRDMGQFKADVEKGIEEGFFLVQGNAKSGLLYLETCINMCIEHANRLFLKEGQDTAFHVLYRHVLVHNGEGVTGVDAVDKMLDKHVMVVARARAQPKVEDTDQEESQEEEEQEEQGRYEPYVPRADPTPGNERRREPTEEEFAIEFRDRVEIYDGAERKVIALMAIQDEAPPRGLPPKARKRRRKALEKVMCEFLALNIEKRHLESDPDWKEEDLKRRYGKGAKGKDSKEKEGPVITEQDGRVIIECPVTSGEGELTTTELKNFMETAVPEGSKGGGFYGAGMDGKNTVQLVHYMKEVASLAIDKKLNERATYKLLRSCLHGPAMKFVMDREVDKRPLCETWRMLQKTHGKVTAVGQIEDKIKQLVEARPNNLGVTLAEILSLRMQLHQGEVDGSKAVEVSAYRDMRNLIRNFYPWAEGNIRDKVSTAEKDVQRKREEFMRKGHLKSEAEEHYPFSRVDRYMESAIDLCGDAVAAGYTREKKGAHINVVEASEPRMDAAGFEYPPPGYFHGDIAAVYGQYNAYKQGQFNKGAGVLYAAQNAYPRPAGQGVPQGAGYGQPQYMQHQQQQQTGAPGQGGEQQGRRQSRAACRRCGDNSHPSSRCPVYPSWCDFLNICEKCGMSHGPHICKGKSRTLEEVLMIRPYLQHRLKPGQNGKNFEILPPNEDDYKAAARTERRTVTTLPAQ